MANKQHLGLLKQGVEAWNQWRRENPDARPDLSQANLTGAHLVEADLSDTNLFWADLAHANLHKADFSRASLFGANLCGANLQGDFVRCRPERHGPGRLSCASSCSRSPCGRSISVPALWWGRGSKTGITQKRGHPRGRPKSREENARRGESYSDILYEVRPPPFGRLSVIFG